MQLRTASNASGQSHASRFIPNSRYARCRIRPSYRASGSRARGAGLQSLRGAASRARPLSTSFRAQLHLANPEKASSGASASRRARGATSRRVPQSATSRPCTCRLSCRTQRAVPIRLVVRAVHLESCRAARSGRCARAGQPPACAARLDDPRGGARHRRPDRRCNTCARDGL